MHKLERPRNIKFESKPLKTMKLKLFLKINLALVIIAIILTINGKNQSLSFAQSTPNSSPTIPRVFNNNFRNLINQVWQIVEKIYIDPKFNGQDWQAVRQKYLNRNYQSSEEVYQAIEEMLELLGDPSTRFMKPEEFKALQIPSEDMGTIGLKINQDKKTQELTVVNPIEKSPAYKAGILPGDVLIKIDGQSTRNMNEYEAIKLIRGPIGSELILTIRRNRQQLNYSITREKFQLEPVYYSKKETASGDIGYIRLTSFSASATEKMRQAIKELEKQQVAGYILDLRSNSGGLFYSAIEIARMWLSKGTIVFFENRQGNLEQQDAKQRATTERPLVILVNEATISASEILASALQENQRAILVGTETRGSNLIQSVRAIGNGSGLAVTIGKWLTPKKNDINQSGLTPDVVINLTSVEQVTMIQEGTTGTMGDPQFVGALKKVMELVEK